MPISYSIGLYISAEKEGLETLDHFAWHERMQLCWSHVLLTSEQFKIWSFNRVRPTRRSTTMAASCYLCLVAVSSRRRWLHGRQSFVIALTKLKFQTYRCCLGPNLSPAWERAEIISLSVHAFTAILLPRQVLSIKCVSLITGLLITGLDWTGLDWNPKICFYTLWYALCHE